MTKKLDDAVKDMAHDFEEGYDRGCWDENAKVLIQAAQDEVWELIEKVMRKTQYETVTKSGDTRYHHRFHIDTPDGLMSFKEAILEADKELEIE